MKIEEFRKNNLLVFFIILGACGLTFLLTYWSVRVLPKWLAFFAYSFILWFIWGQVVVRFASDYDPKPVEKEANIKDDFIGIEGVAHTRMMPSGKVWVDGKIIDSVSSDGAINEGERIKVVSKYGNIYRVKKI